MKAVVLAAGEGRRLRPLTNHRPKPMLPIANRPLLDYVVEAIAAAGIDEVVLVVGYGRERIQTHFGDGDDWDVDIAYAMQEKQLGTGHAVLQVERTVDEPFLVLNGDRVIDPAAVERVAAAVRAGDAPTLAITRSGRPSEYGVVEARDDRLTSLVEKPRAEAVTSDWINAGVYGFDDAVFDAIRETPVTAAGERRLSDTVQRLADDRAVGVVRYDGTWLDVSHLWDLLHVNSAVIENRGRAGTDDAGAEPVADTRNAACEGAGHVAPDAVCGGDVRIDRGAVVGRATSLGDNVRVGPNATIRNAVVMADATIGPGSVLQDCVIAENVRIGANATIGGGTGTVIADGTVHEDVSLGGVIGDNTRVGDGALFEPGTIVGDGATIGIGVVCDGRIAPGAEVRR